MEADLSFDFDEWMTLAKTNPAQFEHRRQAMIDKLIRSRKPEMQQRLRGLQFRIDMERRRSPTPLAACVRLNELLMDQFSSQLAPILTGELPANSSGGDSEYSSAQILPFRRKH